LKFFKEFLNVLYPPLCLHCDNTLEENRSLFCSSCLELLSPIEPDGRCPICFAEETLCARCIKRPIVIKRSAAACSPLGPARTLAAYLDKGNTRYAAAAAGLMALQFAALNWPLPDLIVPFPSSLWTRCKKGSAISVVLAKEMARLLDRPYATALSALGDRRAFLETAQLRMCAYLPERKKKMLTDKRILLIALELNDSSLRQAAEALFEGFASESYALAFILK
jgi:predicted amidophosphoribosyltransferase